MTNKISLTIDSSSLHGGALAVEDVMSQVLDCFRLLKEGDSISWKVVFAKMQSPFQITCEPYSDVLPVFDVDIMASLAKEKFESRIISLLEGELPSAWSTGETLTCAKSILKRSQNGIGRFDIDFNDELPPISIVPPMAINALRKICIEKESWARDELGSIDGVIVDIGFNYSKPAFRIKDRLTKEEIWCLVPPEMVDYISGTTEPKDVWHGQRVIVDGVIKYDKDGHVARIVVNEITKVKKSGVMLTDIIDKNFTDGISPVEYINILRGE